MQYTSNRKVHVHVHYLLVDLNIVDLINSNYIAIPT